MTSLSYVGSIEPSAVQKYISHYKNVLLAEPDDAEAHLGLATCYLSSRLYPLAARHCEKALLARPDIGEVYYYSAISKLAGRRPRKLDRRSVQEVEAWLGTASAIDPSAGHYDLLLAAVRHDYYRANGLRVPSPTDEDLLAGLRAKSLDRSELEKLNMIAELPPGFTAHIA